MAPEVRVLNHNGAVQTTFQANHQNFHGGVHVAVGDMDSDGATELVTGPGAGTTPTVRVFELDGTLIRSFLAYGEGFRGGVNVAVYDLDRDGTAEIITGPGLGGGPEVRVFRADGTRLAAFFAFDPTFRGGVNVAAGRFGTNRQPLIAAASGYGGAHVRLFTPAGKYAGVNLRPFGQVRHGVVVAELPVNTHRSKLVAIPERSAAAKVEIYNLDSPTKPERSFHGVPKRYEAGARLAISDVDLDGEHEIVVGTGPGSAPRVRIFNTGGRLEKDVAAFRSNFRGGLAVAAGPGMVVVGPGAVDLDGRPDLYKYIQIDLSRQTLKYFQNGRLLNTHQVSTGKWDTPTPIGTFAIKNHIANAYSKRYDLYMEWWMAFSPDGSYGIHALPYWKTKNGGKRYEGQGHLGTPVSHGCIRQTLAEAKRLYAWAENGTPVIVKK